MTGTDDPRAHRDCMEALAELERHAAVECPTTAWLERVTPCVDRLATTLRRHFALEEHGSFYRETPTAKPRLADRIDACRAEHARLLDDVDRVAGELGRAGTETALVELAVRASRLVERVRRHEAVEAELMQAAVLRETGTGD